MRWGPEGGLRLGGMTMRRALVRLRRGCLGLVVSGPVEVATLGMEGETVGGVWARGVGCWVGVGSWWSSDSLMSPLSSERAWSGRLISSKRSESVSKELLSGIPSDSGRGGWWLFFNLLYLLPVLVTGPDGNAEAELG